MEKNRIHYAALGWLAVLLIVARVSSAQEALPDSGWPLLPAISDTAELTLPEPAETTLTEPDTLGKTRSQEPPAGKLFRARPDTTREAVVSPADTIIPTVYWNRTYISQGPADEIKGIPGYIVISPGPIGSPAIPIEYLNTPGANITINGLPFTYNGIYRPYLIGTDLNAIPWEIINDVHWEKTSCCIDGLEFVLGKPKDKVDRSDVEVSRGPYGYQSARWRFFSPLGKLTYGYFTVGFNKSSGYIVNSDYDGYHVTGGISRRFGPAQVDLDLWKHRARTGLNSFDFLTDQLSRQSRGIDRAEMRISTPLNSRLSLRLTGLYQRSAQTIIGYVNPSKTNYDLDGGQAFLSDSLNGGLAEIGARYFRQRLFGLPGLRPAVQDFQYLGKLNGTKGRFGYGINLEYSWNGVDHGAFLPAARIDYAISKGFIPFVSLSRFRRLPDLYLLYFNDDVTGLYSTGDLESYHFRPNPELSIPLTSQAAFGIQSHLGIFESIAGISLKKIDSQIYLSYDDSSGSYTESPVNFNDRFLEVFASAKAEYGPFSGDVSGAYRSWSNKNFSDGLEKGPLALGFARLSFLKQVFIPELYLGSSLEVKAASRRDYRSLTVGLTDGFVVMSGRLEFRYKDFTFWLNDDNLTNQGYITWWDFYQSSRTVWWGFRWDFFD